MKELEMTAVQMGNVSLSLREFLVGMKRVRRLRGALMDAVVEKIVVEAARQAGVTVSPEEVQHVADRFRYAHGLTTAEATDRWLESQGLTPTDFEQGVERDILINKFKDALTRANGQAHFDANKDRYSRAKLWLLAVGSEGQANELLCQINEEGRDFAELARQHSQHEPTRSIGGQLGIVLRAHLPPGAGELIFKAREGDVVGPVATNQGFHLYRVEQLLPPEPQATQALVRQELFDLWLRQRLGNQMPAFTLEYALI
jgi:hypothetical protein